MDVQRSFAADYRVRFDEAGPDGCLRSSGFLRFVQDLAWRHSEAAGLDRAWYAARGLTWLVRGVELELHAAVRFGDSVRLSTRVIGSRRVWARRRSEVFLPGRETAVASAFIDWVLVDAAGRPTRVPDEIVAYFEGDAIPVDPARVELPETPADAVRHLSRVLPRDLDPMAHVNNATYLDYLEEALTVASGSDPAARYPRSYQLVFLRSALPDAQIDAGCWEVDGAWARRITDGDGAELMRGRAC
jgi:acyl-CoA thioesterase FadM